MQRPHVCVLIAVCLAVISGVAAAAASSTSDPTGAKLFTRKAVVTIQDDRHVIVLQAPEPRDIDVSLFNEEELKKREALSDQYPTDPSSDQYASALTGYLDKRRQLRAELEKQLRTPGRALDPERYSIQLQDSISDSYGPHGVVVDSIRLADDLDDRTVWIILSVPLRGKGRIDVRPITYWELTNEQWAKRASSAQEGADALSLGYKELENQRFRWQYSLGPEVGTLSGDSAPLLDLNVRSDARLRPTESGFFVEDFALTGKVPIGHPQGVAATGNVDSSGEFADFVEMSYTRRSWRRESGNVSSIGAVARATGRLRGAELVVHYRPFSQLLADNRAFAALAFEGGLKEGDAEFLDEDTAAPDRGSAVLRGALLLEYAPQLGPVNRSLASGVRFFVRGRLWTDRFDDENGDAAWRSPRFVDAELFWNFRPQTRLYVRCEAGSLPPDLSQHVRRVSIGTGSAF